MSDSALSVHGCIRCGRRVVPRDTSPIGLFCERCIPTDATFYKESANIRIRVAVRWVEVSAGRTDLGLFGTEDAPRFVTPHPSDTEAVVERRVGETVIVRMPVSPTLRARIGLGARQRASVEVILTIKTWRADRGQYEDRLLYLNRISDEYLEVWAKHKTAEVMWTSGIQRLSEHKQDGPRPEGVAPTGLRLPLFLADPEVD